MVGIGLTPAWLLPDAVAKPWLLCGIALGIPAVLASWRYAPWVPTPVHDLPRILAALDLSADQHFCDLGAGDGRMLTRIHAATGAQCTGFEISPLLYLLARLRLALSRSRGTHLHFGDLHRQDLSRFDALYVWGTSYWVGHPDFGERIAAAARPGARLVSYQVPVTGLEPIDVDHTGQRPLYVYLIPKPERPHP